MADRFSIGNASKKSPNKNKSSKKDSAQHSEESHNKDETETNETSNLNLGLSTLNLNTPHTTESNTSKEETDTNTSTHPEHFSNVSVASENLWTVLGNDNPTTKSTAPSKNAWDTPIYKNKLTDKICTSADSDHSNNSSPQNACVHGIIPRRVGLKSDNAYYQNKPATMRSISAYSDNPKRACRHNGSDWAKARVKLVSCSVDSVPFQAVWRKRFERPPSLCDANFPPLAPPRAKTPTEHEDLSKKLGSSGNYSLIAKD